MVRRLIDWCISHHRTTTVAMVALTLALAMLAALPSLWPASFPSLHGVTVDTDPENMLPADEPVRVFHNAMIEEFSLYDMLVVGVVNEQAPHYVFNPDTLRDIHELTAYAQTLHGAAIGIDDNPKAGVVAIDIIAPSTVDNVEQAGLGAVSFSWLMPEPPATMDEALAVRDKAMNLPFMKGTLVSEDGQALALYIPLSDKALSYKIATLLRQKIATFNSADTYHITGLPVAEDTFGVEMFKQMAISAPMAMIIIFILLLIFFKKITLIIPPMIVAIVSCIITMAMLVATGNTIHIMSSMVPIFIMPIAVLDSIHILSAFFDRYQLSKDRAIAIRSVMDTLFTPMLYTSLTTAVGFASLALTPIPPVQAFGIYVAIGVMVAWVFTMTFVPASVMFIKESSLANFGLTDHNAAASDHSLLTRALRNVGHSTYNYAKPIIGLAVVLTIAAAIGISKVVINDNPVRWFNPKHDIRVADRVLNEHFGGTYMGYLSFAPTNALPQPPHMTAAITPVLAAQRSALVAEEIPEVATVFNTLEQKIAELDKTAADRDAFFAQLHDFVAAQTDRTDDDSYDAWDAAGLFVSEQSQSGQVFKDPTVLNWLTALQDHLLTIRSSDGRLLVGKSNSLADLVRTIYRELMEGDAAYYRIPDSREGVAQTVLQYESSHRPQDLAHFVRTDTWRNTSLWVQQKSGDNRDMKAITAAVDAYIADNPPPAHLQARWFGLTYINVIWQSKMVNGMLISFIGSFAAVWLMMIILYRSALWGILAMIPLTVTIGAIYGITGYIGKDYDMPVAVLSSLSLGMAVDYAIHFLSRSRDMHSQHGSWKATAAPMFEEPARAITRNVIIVGVGFLPLLAAPLVPYKTVGIFIAAILLLAGVATLFILPAMITILDRWLFRDENAPILCKCGTIFFGTVAAVMTIALNIQAIIGATWNQVSVGSLVVIAAAALFCFISRRNAACRRPQSTSDDQPAN
jgi:predicted RND superfamily exporter protein